MAASILGGLGGGPSGLIGSSGLVGAASTWDASVTAAGSRYLNVATNVSAASFESNLVSNGFRIVKQTIGSNGPVTVLTDGKTTYTIYTATSTGEASAQAANALGQKLVKVRLDPSN